MIKRCLLPLLLAAAALSTNDSAAAAWNGPHTRFNLTGPGAPSLVVDGLALPANWFTGGPYNSYLNDGVQTSKPITQDQLVAWEVAVQAAAKTGLRVFEPLLGQWKLEPTQSADGILASTKALLDAGVAAQPEAVFILRIHMAPVNVSHMYAWAKDQPLTDLGPGRPTPADPEWGPKAAGQLIPFLASLDGLYGNVDITLDDI